MKPILGYWDLRGRGNPARMLLCYAGVDFEDKRYRDANEWFQTDKIKLAGTLDFPNMPYYIDETVQITQSRAILQYLGRKHGLEGGNEKELARMGVILEEVTDLFSALARIAYPPVVANKKEIHDVGRKDYVAGMENKLAAISKFLGSDDWMAGARLTYVDFYIYDVLDFHRRLFLPTHLAKFPNLMAYLVRFEGLKGVKEFLASEGYKPLPVFGPFASFGNTADYEPTE